MKTAFGSLLRKTRTENGLTMKTLGNCCGVSAAYISDVERGNRAPLTLGNIILLCKSLGWNALPLIKAASIENHGFFLRDHVIHSEAKRELGALLSLGWHCLTEEQVHAITLILYIGKKK